MPPASGQTFSPSPDQADRLLARYLDPACSLHDLAREAGATPFALARWLACPEVASRLDALEQAAARRTRALAALHLPEALAALGRLLRDYTQPGSLSDDPDLRRRQHETARLAATLITRLTRWAPGPTPARATSTTASPPATTDGSTTSSTPARRPAPTPDPTLLTRFLALAAAPTSTSPDADTAPATPSCAEAPPAPDPTPAPDTIAALERLAAIPDDAPPEEINALLAAVLQDPSLPALLTLSGAGAAPATPTHTPTSPLLREAG